MHYASIHMLTASIVLAQSSIKKSTMQALCKAQINNAQQNEHGTYLQKE